MSVHEVTRLKKENVALRQEAIDLRRHLDGVLASAALESESFRALRSENAVLRSGAVPPATTVASFCNAVREKEYHALADGSLTVQEGMWDACMASLYARLHEGKGDAFEARDALLASVRDVGDVLRRAVSMLHDGRDSTLHGVRTLLHDAAMILTAVEKEWQGGAPRPRVVRSPSPKARPRTPLHRTAVPVATHGIKFIPAAGRGRWKGS